MRRNRSLSRSFALAVLAATWGWTPIALAEPAPEGATPAAPEPAPPPSASPAEKLEGPLAVVVEIEGYQLDPVNVRLAVARELGVAVTAEPAGASAQMRIIARKGSELSVVYRSPSGAELVRSVAAPARDDEVPEAAALLAGNLARDEASPLIASLTPKEETSPKAEKKPLEKVEAKPLPYAPVNLSLFHPLTIVPDADKHRFLVEFGLFYSRVGEIDAVSLNPLVLQVEGRADGVQIAGVASLNGAGGQGVRIASLFSYQEGDFQGATFSGAVLASQGDERGAKFSGFATLHRGEFLGFTTSGGATINDGNFDGVAVAGATSVVLGDVHGFQAAPVSVAFDVDGGQFGVVNVSRDLQGAQIGVINVGGRVKGLQFGVVNVAEDIDGASIGVLTYSKSGRVQPFVWGSTTSFGNLGVRFYTGPLFAMPTLSVDMAPDPNRQDGPDVVTLSPGFSIGGRVPISRAFVDIEANYSNPMPELRYDEHTIDLRYRIWAGFEVTPWFAPMVGGGVHHHFRTEGDREERFDPELAVGLQFF